jgi:predicted dithiol-disulfide oxidoreductase (DUF899 family)
LEDIMQRKEITDLEQQIAELTQQLNGLRGASVREEIPNYTFETPGGEITLLELFGNKETLFLIHNMGQGCRYCTLWADGLNGFIPHLESAMAVALVSKDSPETQRQFANSRGWRYYLASHGGGDYIKEQTVVDGAVNAPGAVVYERDGGKIYRRNECVFGPGDLYCSMWNILALAGLGDHSWTPQFAYWQRPESLDDGGKNLPE